MSKSAVATKAGEHFVRRLDLSAIGFGDPFFQLGKLIVVELERFCLDLATP